MPVPQVASVVQEPVPPSGVSLPPQLMVKAMVAAAESHSARLFLVML